jgi:hypothetical protein
MRLSGGILIPEPTPGVIDSARVTVPASGRAHGLELSARKLKGRARGFANYSLGWSQQRVGSRAFPASEDRRHVANIGVVADALPSWTVGATLRAQSGAPYTRITLVETGCQETGACGDPPSVLYGTPGGQRAPAFANLDLMTEWTFAFEDWSLTAYGQLRNALGSANAVTYHSSCICIAGESAASADLRDRFDRGLPRLPVVGLRLRF